MRAAEKRVTENPVNRAAVSRDPNLDFEDRRTFGEKVADKAAVFGGSWTFIFIFAGALVAWIILNSFILANRGAAFDPYPYILLNLFLSMPAAIQAPIVMMSQNRRAAKDRLEADTITMSTSKPNRKFAACTTSSTNCAKRNGSN